MSISVKIKASLLKKAISVAKSALPVRAAEPKFDAIWFDGTPESVVVSGMNMDGTIHKAIVDCDGMMGSFALPSGLVANAVGSMPQDEEVEFFVEKNKCVLKNSLGEMKIPVLNVERTTFKERNADLFFECPRQLITKALQAAKFSELSVKGVGTEMASLSVRGGSVFLFCRSSSAGSLAEVCQSYAEDKKVYLDMQKFRRSLAACDGEAISFFAGETSCRIESDIEGMSVSAEFMQAPSHKISIDSMARLDIAAEANVSNVALVKSAISQASVLKLPEHCSVRLGFRAGEVTAETETLNGASSFRVPATCGCEYEALANVEAIERALAIVCSGGSAVRLAVLSLEGEDKVVMLENETKTVRLFSATMERQ